MIREAIQEIKKIVQAERPAAEVLELKDGSGRRYLYNAPTRQYDEIERWAGRTGVVSNVESLVALAVDEMRLRAAEKPPSARIIMVNGGAVFVPDIVDIREQFSYRRKLSDQWTTLGALVARQPSTHKEFARALQGLRPSIPGYSALALAYRSIALDGSTKVLSEPILTRGTKGNSYEFRVSVKGGETGAELPVEIPMRMPVVKGSVQEYEFTAEVDVDFNEGEVSFSLVVPGLQQIVQQVEDDEASWLRTALKSSGLGDIPVLSNYA